MRIVQREPERLFAFGNGDEVVCEGFGVPIVDCSGVLDRLQDLLAGCDVVVDALFGTGLDRPLSDRWLAAIPCAMPHWQR